MRTIPHSWLFTPATNTTHYNAAAAVGAGALILDLEDSVAPADKDQARCDVVNFVGTSGVQPAVVAVRVNALDTPDGWRDVVALCDAAGAPDFLIIPKARSATAIGGVKCVLHNSGSLAVSLQSPKAPRQSVPIASTPAGRRRGALWQRRHGGRPRCRTPRHRRAGRPQRCPSQCRSGGNSCHRRPVLRPHRLNRAGTRRRRSRTRGVRRQGGDSSHSGCGHQHRICTDRRSNLLGNQSFGKRTEPAPHPSTDRWSTRR
jgi:hypothetical protein